MARRIGVLVVWACGIWLIAAGAWPPPTWADVALTAAALWLALSLARERSHG